MFHCFEIIVGSVPVGGPLGRYRRFAEKPQYGSLGLSAGGDLRAGVEVGSGLGPWGSFLLHTLYQSLPSSAFESSCFHRFSHC